MEADSNERTTIHIKWWAKK